MSNTDPTTPKTGNDSSEQSASSSETPVTAQPYYFPGQPAIEQKSGTFSRLILIFCIVALCGSLFVNMLLFGSLAIVASGDMDSRKVQEKHFSHNRGAENKIAIINISGAIFETSEGFVKKQIDQVKKDKSVKGVVLRVNSPGGTIAGSDYILHHLREMKKEKGDDFKIVVSMGSLAASGGYYVSMAVDDTPKSIFAEQSTWTGSIGVVIPHYNLQELMGHIGIKDDSIAKGEFKGMGSFSRPMTEAEKERFEGLAGEAYERFKEVVASGRPKLADKEGAVAGIATGEIFTAEQALKNGLIDEIGFIEKAIDRSIELAGLDAKNVEVVRYRPEPTLSSILFGSQANAEVEQLKRLRALLESVTPQGFYLCSYLPPLGE